MTVAAVRLTDQAFPWAPLYSVDGAARALLGRLWRNELQPDAAHPCPAGVRPREVDVALVPDFAFEGHLRPAVRRGEGHLHPGPERKGLAGLDEHAKIRDVSADTAGDAPIAFEEDLKCLVEPGNTAG